MYAKKEEENSKTFISIPTLDQVVASGINKLNNRMPTVGNLHNV